jgi:molecular chaperone HtpG
VDEFIPQTLNTYLEKGFCNALSEDLGLETEEEKEEAKKKAELLKGFLDFVSEKLGESVKEVRLSRNLGSHPVALVPEQGMSFEMEKYMKRANPEFAFSVGRILELNEEHEAVKAMQLAIGTEPEKAEKYAKLLYSQACLMADLPIDDPVEYTKLVCELMR